tara:strand:+ start:127 stop:618 length:492 start_codon:yes stop_codon:yes gene_type:complete
MIKKILILIFFIVSSASPLFACETEKIKSRCENERIKMKQTDDFYRFSIVGIAKSYISEAACINTELSNKFDRHYDGKPYPYDLLLNPNTHIPERTSEMFAKLFNAYYEVYIELEQAKQNDNMLYIFAARDTLNFAHLLLDQMYETTGTCKLADSRNSKSKQK